MVSMDTSIQNIKIKDGAMRRKQVEEVIKDKNLTSLESFTSLSLNEYRGMNHFLKNVFGCLRRVG